MLMTDSIYLYIKNVLGENMSYVKTRLEILMEMWIRHQENDYGNSGDLGPVSDQDIHNNIVEGVSVYGSESELEKSLEEFFKDKV